MDVALFSEDLGWSLELPLLSPFCSPWCLEGHTSSLFFLRLTLPLETLTLNACFQGSALEPPQPPTPNPNQLLSSAW